MKLVGLTGGIGSGKSTVGRLLATHGAVVCDVDQIARDVLGPGAPALAEVRAAFGDSVFHADETLDRQALAAIVFPDPDALRTLEEITHPHIKQQLTAWIMTQQARVSDGTPVVIDHPLLIETQDLSQYDAVVVVTCDETLRRDRLVSGRGLDPKDVAARIAAQIDDDTRRTYATHIVDNSGDETELAAAVAELYAELTTATDDE